MENSAEISGSSLWVKSGIAGILSVACYILAITLPWPETQFGLSASLVIASAWPILSIIFAYGLYSYIAVARQSHANRLAFVFTVAAFSIVLAMLTVQLAVGASISEITGGLDQEASESLSRGLRMIDMGLDVAWDMLLAAALIFLGVALKPQGVLGPVWAIPAIVLGAVLAVVNAATFPWPPSDVGIMDIGPVIGLFMTALAVRLIILGRNSGLYIPRRPEDDL